MCKFSTNFIVEVGHEDRDEVIQCVAMLDTQAERSFCVKELADKLGLAAPYGEYHLGTLSSLSTFFKGNKVSGIRIRNPLGGVWISLPMLLTNEFIPEVSSKRASREVVRCIDHLSHLSENFLPENNSLRTLLLLGEDVQELFKINSHGAFAPYAQETDIAHVGPRGGSRWFNKFEIRKKIG